MIFLSDHTFLSDDNPRFRIYYPGPEYFSDKSRLAAAAEYADRAERCQKVWASGSVCHMHPDSEKRKCAACHCFDDSRFLYERCALPDGDRQAWNRTERIPGIG